MTAIPTVLIVFTVDCIGCFGWTSSILMVASQTMRVVFTVNCIGCFECTSINGSHPDCEDTFGNTGGYYKADCLAGRKDRSGMFLGTECVKVTAQHPGGHNTCNT